jgi:predicted amidophosphoribosyltransferase
MSVWKRIDSSHNLKYITENDICIYAREYKAGQGYQAGETNQLIYNFKKSPAAKNTGQWKYRDRDVKKFAEEVSNKFFNESSAAVTAIPSSKEKNDPEYTNRFEDMLSHLKTLRPNVQIEWPISLIATVEPAHLAGSRDPETIKQNYQWDGFVGGTPETLVVFDDVVTTGSHFRAFADFSRENGFEGKIIGIFWARAIFPSAEDVFDVVEEES